MLYHIFLTVHLWIIPHYTLPGQSKGAGDQAQIASKQSISQGKGHEPSCCASQGGTSPVSIRIVWRAYTSSHPIGVHAGPASCGAVQFARQPLGDRCNAEGRVDPPQSSVEFVGRLFNYDRSNPSVRNALHWHVRWQAHRQAHDWRQGKNIASVIAISTKRPHRSRGMRP